MTFGIRLSTLIGHVERSNVIPLELIMMVRVWRPWNPKTLLGDPLKTNKHMFCISVYVMPCAVPLFSVRYALCLKKSFLYLRQCFFSPWSKS
jgi:hypothetical protein